MPVWLIANWKLIARSLVYGGFGIALLLYRNDARHWHKQYDVCQENRKLDQAAYRSAVDAARIYATERARKIEQQQSKISEETQNDLSAKIEKARAATRDYVSRMRDATAAAKSRAGQADLPATGATSGDSTGTSKTALVPLADLQVCGENTVKAQGWQDWYAKISTADGP